MKIIVDIHDELLDEVVIHALLDALECKEYWDVEPTLEQSIKEVLAYYGKETS